MRNFPGREGGGGEGGREGGMGLVVKEIVLRYFEYAGLVY